MSRDESQDRVWLQQQMNRALNTVAKWRSWFAGWQLGTRSDTDPECNAVRNHREATIIQRVEITAITGLLLKKGIITEAELMVAFKEEAEALNESFARSYPGVRAVEYGLDMKLPEAAETMKRMHFKP
jgi:hypothetical protein